ncbi:Inactive tetrahydrocannabinolic acid synthase [Lasiodiplodia hormozganensis]|uniref:Inactive tetrahydrocannabinolic acid synthase n=1 Tax=Lasiodiplodia hormozganensis TaxID=869390 RepID=A0AA40D6W6_9PEZI|nr:Inactive tetrahydrocannabinolic acid synthase [Lasiodiplodia hormozganensis]
MPFPPNLPPIPTDPITASNSHHPLYEPLRTRFFNARLPTTQPLEIVFPRTTAAAASCIRAARARNLHVGVRSGGHNFAAPALVAGGVLLDTLHLNADEFSYDRRTQLVSFGPGATAARLAPWMRDEVGRFWPFGHSPSVGVGGFLCAGGQGWFMRGWGATAGEWVERLEIVTPDGEVRVASRTENEDLFWAARGGGLAFFGVVTRIWGRTVRMRRVWGRTLVFGLGGGGGAVEEEEGGERSRGFEEVMEWALETDATASPKYGVETAIVTCYTNRVEEDYYPDEEDQAMCLPQQYHVSTMTCWHDPAKDEEMKKWIHDAYSRAQPVSVGQYVADFDENHRITKVMTDNALKRFLQIREKYDPQEMFIGYRGLAKVLDRYPKL